MIELPCSRGRPALAGRLPPTTDGRALEGLEALEGPPATLSFMAGRGVAVEGRAVASSCDRRPPPASAPLQVGARRTERGESDTRGVRGDRGRGGANAMLVRAGTAPGPAELLGVGWAVPGLGPQGANIRGPVCARHANPR